MLIRAAILVVISLGTACTALKARKYPLSITNMGTDFHMHIHTPPKEYDDMQFNAERALFAADSIELKRILVLPNSYSKGVTEAYAIKENNFIQSEVIKNKSRISGACAVNPAKNWAAKEIKRCASLGLKVLKLHFMASGLDLKKESDFKIASDIVREAEINNFTILVHANYPRSSRPGEIEKLKQLIEIFPKTRWIIGHLFGREFGNLNDLKHSNFFVEISVTPIWMRTDEDRKQLVSTMREVGIERFLFGSDWPVIHPAETLKALNALPLTDKEHQMILYTNASQLNDLFE